MFIRFKDFGFSSLKTLNRSSRPKINYESPLKTLHAHLAQSSPLKPAETSTIATGSNLNLIAPSNDLMPPPRSTVILRVKTNKKSVQQ